MSSMVGMHGKPNIQAVCTARCRYDAEPGWFWVETLTSFDLYHNGKGLHRVERIKKERVRGFVMKDGEEVSWEAGQP